jgi:signal transduction histidine kinase
LQEHVADYKKQQIAVFAICPEPVDMLGAFAAEHNITYELLSDRGARIIRRLSILNTEVPESDPVYGIPYPGSYLVDERGLIFEKRFHADFHVREPMGSLLLYFQLKEYSERLEQKVEERTRELQQVYLQMTERARLATLGKLIAAINHELNTPVGALASGLEVLWKRYARACEQAGPSAQAAMTELRQAIDAACQRIVQVVAGLREFIRLDEAEAQSVDLRRCLDTVAELLGPRVGRRIRLRREFEEIPAVYCHAAQLNQALWEIVTNAVDSITGQGTITLGARRINGEVVLTVSDTGPGIPPEELAQLFEPRLKTKDGRMRMCLGLALASKIVNEEGGRIEATSAPGAGATIAIYLPAGRQEPDPARRAPHVRS